MRERGFILPSGITLYVLVAAVLTFAGLSLAVAYYKNSAARADAEATLARDQRDRAVQAVKDQEEAIKAISAAKAALDEAIVERDKRAKALTATTAALRSEINVLKQSLDEADRTCLDRDLPPAILERLRDGPGNPDKN